LNLTMGSDVSENVILISTNVKQYAKYAYYVFDI